MTGDQRHSSAHDSSGYGPAIGPASRRCYRSLRTIALAWLSIAGAPILWASVDGSAAHGSREPSALHAVGTPGQAARPVTTRVSDWGVRRLNSHV
jgi:hypothetical protein